MIKAVVFDLDHTLFDRYETFRAGKDIIYRCGKDYISKDYDADSFIEKVCELDKKYIVYEWNRVKEELIKAGAVTHSPEHFYDTFIREAFMTVAKKFDFTIPMLDTLHKMGLKCGVITNGRNVIQRRKIELLELTDKIDLVLCSEEVGEQKPSTLPFIRFSEKIGIAPGDMLYVGDHPKNDVDASRRAGYIPVWVKTYGVWLDGIRKADYEVDTVKEIPNIIKEIN